MAMNSPDDPYRGGPYQAGVDDTSPDHPRSPQQFDRDLQADPEMTEGPLSGGRIAAIAAAIILVFAAVFYGMNATSTNPGEPTVATTPTTTPGNAPTPPSGQANTQPGMTTGAAPANPQKPENAPTGEQVDRAASPK